MRPIKKHGFSCPLHPLQILSWLIIFYTLAASFTVAFPLLPPSPKIVFGVCFSLLEGSLLIAGFLATKLDPTDLMVYKKKAADENAEYRAFCSICNCNVSLTSKHCGQCNRCVDNFDHHCKWLNNCIGRRNYWLFVYLIVNLELASVFAVVFASLVFSHIALDPEFGTRLEDVYSGEYLNTVIALLALLLLMNGCVIVANGQLIGLHIWLKFKGMSTYDYIMNKRRNKCRKTEAVNPEPDAILDDIDSDRQVLSPPGSRPEDKPLEKLDSTVGLRTGTHMSRSNTNVLMVQIAESAPGNTIETS